MSERNKVIAALTGSLLLHLLIILLIAAGVVRMPADTLLLPEPKAPDRPMEVTLLSLPTEPKPKPDEPAFIRTTREQESETRPKLAPFESDKNTLAASESAPSGNAPLPSQEGKDRPFIDFKTQQLSLNGPPRESSMAQQSNPQPTPAPQPKPKPKPEPTPEPIIKPKPTPPPDTVAMLRATTRPVPTPEPEQMTPPQPTPQRSTTRPNVPGYQPQTEKTRIRGNRGLNIGIPAVDAAATPLGKYKQQVADAIGSRWYQFIEEHMDKVTIGTATMKFSIDKHGKVRDLRVVSNDSNEIFATYTIQSISKADIPPIPEDIASSLQNGRVEIEYSFTLYSN